MWHGEPERGWCDAVASRCHRALLLHSLSSVPPGDIGVFVGRRGHQHGSSLHDAFLWRALSRGRCSAFPWVLHQRATEQHDDLYLWRCQGGGWASDRAVVRRRRGHPAAVMLAPSAACGTVYDALMLKQDVVRWHYWPSRSLGPSGNRKTGRAGAVGRSGRGTRRCVSVCLPGRRQRKTWNPRWRRCCALRKRCEAHPIPAPAPRDAPGGCSAKPACAG